MKIVAFLGSPRLNGNSEIMLEAALKPIREEGHDITVFRPSRMKFSPCINCGGCEQTGICILKDDMDKVYPVIRDSSRFILSCPIFFFGLTAQMKALIDRCQSFWCEKYLLKKEITSPFDRKGLVLLVGGMAKEIGYTCGGASAKAFFRTIGVPKHEELHFMNIDEKGAILKHPAVLEEIGDAGKRLVRD